MKRTLKFLLPCFLHSEFDKRINLGLLYLNGKGVARDYGEARRLFEQGAAMGNAACMNGLGAIYNEGDGVRRDVKLARQWFEKAAALGNPEATQNLRGMRK